jgi:RND superfamily putative drug exporter
MHILGKANWSLPAALDRRLPHLELEAAEEAGQAPPGRSPDPAAVP